MSDRVVVIGDPNSVFVQSPVRYWRDRGIDAVILTARWEGPSTVDGDLPVVAAESVAPAWVKTAADGLYSFLDRANSSSLAQDPERVRNALRAWAHTAVPPSVAPPGFDALLIAAAADALEPACVFGHEAFAYGLATSMCNAPRKALMAWGADVLQYAPMTHVAFALVRQALHGVHYVLTNTLTMEDALHERFDLPRARIAQISYGVDRRKFARATGERAKAIRATYAIPSDARVLMNIRRFLPHWGTAVAWPAMLETAAQRPGIHLVLLGGPDTDTELDRAATEAESRGLANQLTMIRGNASLDTVAELMSVADVSLSMVGVLEPVSWSVLQAAACGSAVIVGDQASYAHESARGLAIHRIPPTVSETVAAIAATLDHSDGLAGMRDENARYITTHHDRDAHMSRLLRIVAGRETAERLLRPDASRRQEHREHPVQHQSGL